MKSIGALLCFVLSGLLIWWTLESDAAHRQAEADTASAYLEVLDKALTARVSDIVAAVPLQTQTSTYAQFIDQESLGTLTALNRYSSELDAFLTHRMQMIYLRHDTQQIQLIAGDAVLLSIPIAVDN